MSQLSIVRTPVTPVSPVSIARVTRRPGRMTKAAGLAHETDKMEHGDKMMCDRMIKGATGFCPAKAEDAFFSQQQIRAQKDTRTRDGHPHQAHLSRSTQEEYRIRQ